MKLYELLYQGGIIGRYKTHADANRGINTELALSSNRAEDYEIRELCAACEDRKMLIDVNRGGVPCPYCT